MRSPPATTRPTHPLARLAAAPTAPYITALAAWALLAACKPTPPVDADAAAPQTTSQAAPAATAPAPGLDASPPDIAEDLTKAQAALATYDWAGATDLLNHALGRHPQHPEALALLARANAEARAQRRIQEAIDHFNAARFDDAELKLGGIPTDSAYHNQREEILAWISHAQAFPSNRVRATDNAPMRRILIGPFPRGADDADIKFAVALCKRALPDAPCKPEDFASEQPQRQVYINTFYIDTYEVSSEQYSRCVTAGACAPVNWQFCALAGEQPALDQPSQPQVCVTWQQADTYCSWAGARLPTEAEWEKAAKGPDLTRFPWGDKWDPSAANWSDAQSSTPDGFPKLAPVRAFSPNGFGLYNTAGNAFEWTQDVFDPHHYKLEPPDGEPVHLDPQGPPPAGALLDRTIRGGSFESTPLGLRASARAGMRENTRSRGVGFRCAQDP
jgi:formylglycine-generating enzyme required for sulfatase activity